MFKIKWIKSKKKLRKKFRNKKINKRKSIMTQAIINIMKDNIKILKKVKK